MNANVVKRTTCFCEAKSKAIRDDCNLFVMLNLTKILRYAQNDVLRFPFFVILRAKPEESLFNKNIVVLDFKTSERVTDFCE